MPQTNKTIEQLTNEIAILLNIDIDKTCISSIEHAVAGHLAYGNFEHEYFGEPVYMNTETTRLDQHSINNNGV